MRLKVVAIAVGLAPAIVAAQTHPTGEPFFLHEQSYPAEMLGAMLCGALVGAGTAATFGFASAAVLHRPYPASDLGVQVGAALGYPLGCGLGTILVGKTIHEEGNTGAAYGGAYAGLALGALAGPVTGRWDLAILPMVGLPPAGAYIGYYLNRAEPGEARNRSIDERLLTPGLALASAELSDLSVQYGVKVQLAGLRF